MYKTALIKKPMPQDDHIRYPDGLTKDIIETVLFADKKAAVYTADFAKSLQKKTLIETCRNIWQFVKTQIPYKLDPQGHQWVKSPGRLWQDKAGDCKSFSVFTASCLKNLGIPYGYRFASYSKTDPAPTHVYVYVPAGKGRREIILDSVWTGPFNTQKEYTYKQDKLMTRIAYLGTIGAGAPPKHVPTVLRLTKDVSEISEHEMDLLLARQRLEIEKENSAAVGGPFNWQIDRYDKAIGVVNNALANIDNPEYMERLANHFDAAGQPVIGGFFKKIWKGIKKIGKGIVKVVTFPLRLIAKGIMEIYLPKAAYGFLYLFAAEKTLPDKMKAKRKKAEKFKNFVCKKIGMKEKHFMGIVRNSLTKKLRMSPESYLAKNIRAVAVKGIGAIGRSKKKVNRQRNKKRWMPEKINSKSLRDNSGQSIDENYIDDNGVVTSRQSKGEFIVEAASKFDDVGRKISDGNVFGAVIAAISWIISKLGGKKAGVDLSADDLPNLEEDAGDAFKYNDLKEDYGNLSTQQKSEVKDVATDLINDDFRGSQASNIIRQKLPYLNSRQVNEISSEVEEGFEPVTESDGLKIARSIKMNANNTAMNLEALEASGGGAKGGICKC